MELSVQNVYGLLIRSRLLPRDALQAMLARWQTEARGAADDKAAFLRWLVASEYLTEFQAGLIARGRADSFFLNGYKLLDRIGAGRLAGLYQAAHSLGQVVAIKVLSPTRSRDPAAVARFQRGARLAMRLRHPNVVRVFQLAETGGLPFLVMEYLEGETLEDLLRRRGRLPPEEAVRLIYQALLGLQHVHEQGGNHRDLNPANLILVSGGSKVPADTLRATVKLIDVHLERALAVDTADAGGEEPALGKPEYLAPEQARNADNADIRADIYSLGCILYQALASQPPFPDANPINQMIRHAQETPRPLREFNPEVPDGLQQIVNWMMAKDPAQRYPTPERAAQALQVFLAAGTEMPAAPEAAPQLRSYLTWLESEEHGPAATASQAESPAAGAASPVAVNPKERPLRPLAAEPAGELPARPRKSGHRHHTRKSKHLPQPVAAPEAPRAPEPEPAWDVELVPGLPFQQVAFSLRGLVVTRRDLLMLGIGAGTAATAGLITFAVAQLRARRDKGGAPGPEETPTLQADE
jgi:serine/threonine protein kinase